MRGEELGEAVARGELWRQRDKLQAVTRGIAQLYTLELAGQFRPPNPTAIRPSLAPVGGNTSGPATRHHDARRPER